VLRFYNHAPAGRRAAPTGHCDSRTTAPLTNGGGSPLLNPPANGATVGGGVRLRKLRGDGGSGHPPMDELRGEGTVLHLIGTGNPFDLTGLQVGAGSVGVEGHRLGLVVN